ncbi:hypothetical protein DI272_19140 [Streptomyces sp. Act143]|uniref:hypothetical protein n=1 Tax=Streptomyces sp. Act143 TaxID=2200760 RepID=UPI000D676B79|nr:hypothetical protein [Streptomyces sp. Act143]PWI16047.1 hypothetical protein DI272_19140 [Streptomyces sp. Act143]
MSTLTPQPGDIVRVTYAAVWAPEDGDARMVVTGNGDGDRWHNIVPDGAEIEIVCRAGEIPGPDSPVLCPQNRRGDQRTPEPHFYKPDDNGILRCLFCSQPAHWGGESPRAWRTPDGRVWTQAREVNEHGVALYEAPYVPQRYTALALETMYAEQGAIEAVDDTQARLYVLNARSVNRSPGTAVKHIPDGHGRTICPGEFQASRPLPQEEAEQFALCNGCRRTLLARYDVAEPAPAARP